MLPYQILLGLGRKIQAPYYVDLVFIIAIGCVFGAMKLMGKPKNFSIRSSGNWILLRSAWYVFFTCLFLGIFGFLSIDFQNTPTFTKVFFFFVRIILGVIYEEFLFRGVIQNKILESFENTQASKWKGIVLASAVFSLVHLLNLIGAPYLILGTVTQVIYTFCLGLLLGVVYFIAKNIWISVILHMSFNVFGSYSILFIKEEVQSSGDIPFWWSCIQILLMVPCVFFAYRIYKKKLKIS